MPTYQYRCKACDHDLEVVQAFTDDPLTTCPECSGQLKKVYGAVGISFKGSGFYKTDSRGSKKSSNGGSSSDSSTKSDSTTKTDSSSSSDSGSGDKKSGDKKSSDTKAGDKKSSSTSATSSSSTTKKD